MIKFIKKKKKRLRLNALDAWELLALRRREKWKKEREMFEVSMHHRMVLRVERNNKPRLESISKFWS